MAVKKKTQKYWKTKIDKVFHEYVRRRDADNDSGYCKCISCNKPIHFTESDAGHFIGRGALATRYDEQNVHAQCRKCNRFQYGRQIYKMSDAEWLEVFEEFRDKLKAIKELQDF